MEHKAIENIDIERSKELFEYEMTEVLLKLKGEFAVVSGKDTYYGEVAVDAEDLSIDIAALPAIEQNQVQIQAPSTDIAEIEIKPVKTGGKVKAEIPIIPKFAFTMPQRKASIRVNVSVPTTHIISSRKVPDVVAKPFSGAVPEINMLNMPKAVDNNDTLVSVITVAIPKTSDQGYSYKMKGASDNYQNKTVLSKRHIEGVVVPSTCQFSVKPISMKTSAINLPCNISINPHTVVPTVSTLEKAIVVDIPKTQIGTRFSSIVVNRTPVTTVAPNTTINISGFDKAAIENATPIDIEIPSLRIPRITPKKMEKRYEIQMPDINTKIDCKNSIPKLVVKSHAPSIVSSAPNCSAFIEDILRSVAKA